MIFRFGIWIAMVRWNYGPTYSFCIWKNWRILWFILHICLRIPVIIHHYTWSQCNMLPWNQFTFSHRPSTFCSKAYTTCLFIHILCHLAILTSEKLCKFSKLISECDGKVCRISKGALLSSYTFSIHSFNLIQLAKIYIALKIQTHFIFLYGFRISAMLPTFRVRIYVCFFLSCVFSFCFFLLLRHRDWNVWNGGRIGEWNKNETFQMYVMDMFLNLC